MATALEVETEGAVSPHIQTLLLSEILAPRIGIIDIGSNSVRLVVYKGLSRAPAVLFNEKVMAGLGKGLANGDRLTPESVELAIGAISRFALLADAMKVDSLRAVATAAVREARNGQQFVDRVRETTGVAVEIIDGETEARCAALGVIAGIPHADGVVGDLGGGSLELVRVREGDTFQRVSLPLGTLKLDAMRQKSARTFVKKLEKILAQLDWAAEGAGRPFYAVGGSWRALAHLHMHLTDWPLPVIHHYMMDKSAPERLVRTLSHMPLKSLKRISSISGSRAPQLMGAALLLRSVVKRLGSSSIIMSAYGLREGLLYSSLAPDAQQQDPLIAGCQSEAIRSGRLSDSNDIALGNALLAFTDPLFPDETPDVRRIRHAACLLSDTAWRSHPDMRAEAGLDLALHGNWVGIDARERAMLATALFVVNGGDAPGPETGLIEKLAPPEAFRRAQLWGLAMRLGQRLGGGSAELILKSRAERDSRTLTLCLSRDVAALYGDAVRRRHRILAQALGLEPVLRILPSAELTAPSS